MLDLLCMLCQLWVFWYPAFNNAFAMALGVALNQPTNLAGWMVEDLPWRAEPCWQQLAQNQDVKLLTWQILLFRLFLQAQKTLGISSQKEKTRKDDTVRRSIKRSSRWSQVGPSFPKISS